MNATSWRHHYLPIFYLKGFTRQANGLKIYDVVNKQFIKNGKSFSLKSIFFEEDGNTIINEDGHKDDFLENYYSEIETKISKLISKINSSTLEEKYGVTDDDMPLLNMFVSLMYWRLPHKQPELKSFVKETDFKYLGLRVHNADSTVSPEAEEKLRNNERFLKVYKFYNALMDSVRGLHCRTPYTILEKDERWPYICSDNPIIYERLSPNVFEDDYIFPLSGSKLFVKANKREKFDSVLWYLVDLLCFMQSVKYVSFTDEKYAELLNSAIEKNNYKEEELRFEIFKRFK